MIKIHGEKPSDEVIKELKEIPADIVIKQLNKRPDIRYKKLYNHFDISIPYEMIQIDLLTLPSDNGYKYVICVVDCASRFKWAQPLKNKNANGVLNAFQKMDLRIDKVKKVNVDGGGEFKGVFKDFLDDLKIEIIVNKPGHHLAFVENMNRNLAKRIFEFQSIAELESKKKFVKWINILQTIVNDMNDSVIDSIEMKPVDAIKLDFVKQPTNTATKQEKNKRIPNGTIVRRLLKSDQYQDLSTGKIKIENRRRATDSLWSVDLYYVYDSYNCKSGDCIYYHSIIPIEKEANIKNVYPHRFTYWQLQVVK
jgi:hypothetical protein